MKFTPKSLNRFLLLQLPSAYFTGVRVTAIDDSKAIISVKHRWISQNPFNSLYYGVQAMAAELSTGVLVMKKVQESGKPISMLVTKQDAVFTKKARGVVRFICEADVLIDSAISETIKTGEGQILVLNTKALNENDELVSEFNFEWSIKIKSKK